MATLYLIRQFSSRYIRVIKSRRPWVTASYKRKRVLVQCCKTGRVFVVSLRLLGRGRPSGKQYVNHRMCTPRSIEPSPFGRRTLITLERPIKNHTRSKSPPSPCAATSKFDLAITKIGLIYHFNCNKKLIFSTGVDEGIAPRQCNLDRVTFGRRVH